MLQFYIITNAVVNNNPVGSFCFTTAQHLGQYLESRGVPFSGNGVNDLSKHYGQHIITRLLDGLKKSGGFCGYGFHDFPKMLVDGRGDGHIIAETLKRKGVIHPTHIKPIIIDGEEHLALDVFSYRAVEALLESWGLNIKAQNFHMTTLSAGPVYFEFNNRNGVITPNSNKKPLWANSNANTTPKPVPHPPTKLEPAIFNGSGVCISEGGCVPNVKDDVTPTTVVQRGTCKDTPLDPLYIIAEHIRTMESELDALKEQLICACGVPRNLLYNEEEPYGN
ncbi:MAG: hypothetical protein IJA19_00260 [Clostridia bacterium]|nr:hypothetical protein [Clostridia bacterium]